MKPLKTKRFLIKKFCFSDITIDYLNWFKDPKNKFIVNKIDNIIKLKKYALTQLINKKIYFFSIYDLKKKIHIGNIKLNKKNSTTYTLGILIGNSKYQGKGVFHEVFLVLKKWIRKDTKIKVIRAGVDIDNINSISAFLKCGFKPISKNTKKITYEILL